MAWRVRALGAWVAESLAHVVAVSATDLAGLQARRRKALRANLHAFWIKAGLRVAGFPAVVQGAGHRLVAKSTAGHGVDTAADSTHRLVTTVTDLLGQHRTRWAAAGVAGVAEIGCFLVATGPFERAGMRTDRRWRSTRDRWHQNGLAAGTAELIKTRLETPGTLALVANLFAAVGATVEGLITRLVAEVVAFSVAWVSALRARWATLDIALVATAALRTVTLSLAKIFRVSLVARPRSLGLAAAAMQLHHPGTGGAGCIVTDSLTLVATGKWVVTNSRACLDGVQAAAASLDESSPAAGAGLDNFGVAGTWLTEANMTALRAHVLPAV